MKRTGTLALSLLLLLALTGSVQSQRYQRRAEFTEEEPGPSIRREFTFARLRYTSNGWGQGWRTDYPKADRQLLIGLRNWCRSSLAISSKATTTAFDPKELAQYPFIYAVEPGQMELSEDDAVRLREYLERGGFLMLDDFWGEYEWQNVKDQMRKVFPERTIVELPLDHPIFHCYFDITEVIQVPNVDNIIYRGRTDEKGGVVPYYEGILDDQGRVMVFIARNCDNGDAWEWIDEPRYPLKYGLAAYKLGMNVIVYAMTH